MKKIVTAALAAILCSLVFLSSATAGEPKVLRMALGDPEDSEMGVAGKIFKQYVEEHSQGKIQVELFFFGSLGDETDTVQSVSMGILDMSMVGVANVVPYARELGVLTLPYIFDDVDDVIAATTGAPAELLNSYAERAGFRVMAWTYTGFRNLSNSRHPVLKMSDLKGLKIRVPQNPVLLETYKAFGATPVYMPWSLAFLGLKNGIVDGQCYGYIGFRAMKFLDANQKYITETHYTYQLQPLIMSTLVYRKFSHEEKELLKAAGKAAQEAALRYEIRETDLAKLALLDSGAIISRLEDEDDWKRTAIERVWPKMIDYVGGRHALNAFLQACGKQPWKGK